MTACKDDCDCKMFHPACYNFIFTDSIVIAEVACLPTQFQCSSNNQCIDKSQQCNGKKIVQMGQMKWDVETGK